MDIEKIKKAKRRDDLIDDYVDIIDRTINGRITANEVRAVNAAIIERWSLSALKYIKQKSWKIHDNSRFGGGR